MADMKLDFCGVPFKNPVVIASLETTNSPDLMKQAFDYGASGAIIKTLTDIDDMAVLTMNSKYAIMNDRGDIIKGKVPRDFKFYSRSGYSSTYYKDWIPYLKEVGAYARERDAHLIGSAGAKDVQGWIDICRTIEDCGLPMVELNFGCPHPALMPGVHGGSMIGQNPEVAADVTRAVCEAVDIPVVIKLTPDQSRPVDVARAVKEAGAAAVTATNRYTGFAVDIDTAEPRLGGTAGIGGTWTKPLSLRYVHNIYKEVGIPIAGSNGVFDHRDVVEFIMTGADIVEVGSVLMVKGMKWLPNIIRGLERFMDEHEYKDIASMRGIASDAAATDYSDQFAKSRETAEVNAETCQNPTCNVCVQMCFYEALSQDPAGKINVHNDKCIGCELCMDICPFDSIKMVPTSDADYADGHFKIKDDIYEPADAKFATKRNNVETIEADAPKIAAE
ncbi:MAG: tRNA-dihydrouridine synthase [Alphaproteobacteria bacterium]|jgi:dihydroorotate dehydrogenase (fumarate)/dihydropyrimidine dehydrogenase (NAD+) subunit PreA|nr:tRNA-dihydrouridine synthase [Alphaproteobacteria bacterium]